MSEEVAAKKKLKPMGIFKGFAVAGVEPEEMDFERVLEIARPYLGDVVGVYGDWTPLQDRERLFAEDLDRDDPWQFKNIRVS